jgi:hypothetical protein
MHAPKSPQQAAAVVEVVVEAVVEVVVVAEAEVEDEVVDVEPAPLLPRQAEPTPSVSQRQTPRLSQSQWTMPHTERYSDKQPQLPKQLANNNKTQPGMPAREVED